MEVTATVDWRAAAAVLFALACFGWGYNRLVGSLEESGEDRGYVGFLVALGCFVTIAGFALIAGSPVLGLILLACFAASGVFMIWGSVARHVRARAQEEARARQEAEESLP